MESAGEVPGGGAAGVPLAGIAGAGTATGNTVAMGTATGRFNGVAVRGGRRVRLGSVTAPLTPGQAAFSPATG